MNKLLLSLAAAALLFAADPACTAEADDPQATWNLTDLYPSVAAWEQARDEVMADFEKIDGMRGSLGTSADSLYDTYRFVSDTYRKAGRVYVYASLNADEDLRDSETQERRQLADIMFARFGEVTAWMQPELIEVGREVIESYIKEDERLAAVRVSARRQPAQRGPHAEPRDRANAVVFLPDFRCSERHLHTARQL